MRICILADDFTGAGDVGIQLRKFGFNVKIHTNNNFLEKNDDDVIVINTNTRNDESGLSKKIINKTMEFLNKTGYDKLYKKIDSTLRGNIKEEVIELKKHIKIGEKICIIIGFPKMGRQILDGKHYLNGTLLTNTEFAKDVHKPVKSSDLRDYFSDYKIIKLDEIRGNLEENLSLVNEDIIIFDSETEKDLEIIAKSIVTLGYDKNVVGSAGVMNYLPKYWNYKKNRVFMLSGSCSEKNILQVNEFKKYNDDNIYIYKINYNISIEENIKIIENFCENNDIFLISIDKKDDILKEKLTLVTDYNKNIAFYIIKKYNIKNLFLTGGETAIETLELLNINKLNVIDEIDTGVVIYKDMTGEFQIISKPGAFGNNDIYKKAYEKLKNVENII
ncbi:MAG: four-carbon acid sugar kinase family protein [Fusobacteria bacterium]|nr:four-carbon acid sugar kinase family protein [Fusobacteriota bacterium]